MSTQRLKYLVQLLATITVLILVQGNLLKTALLLTLWGVTFFPLALHEILIFFGACFIFFILDVMAVKQGIFYFTQPDFLGIPLWECFMYGFYVLHGLRMLGGPVPKTNKIIAGTLAVAFVLCFSCISDQNLLTYITFALLALSITFFHEKYDLLYLGYFVCMGLVIEYLGVRFNLWAYPQPSVVGFPVWFITMWGSIGLFLRRLILPILA